MLAAAPAQALGGRACRVDMLVDMLGPSCSSRAQPNGRIVKSGAAIGPTRFGANESVDAPAFFKRMIWPDALDDDDAGLHAIEALALDDNRTTRVADASAFACL